MALTWASQSGTWQLLIQVEFFSESEFAGTKELVFSEHLGKWHPR